MNGRSVRWRLLAWAGAMALMTACGRKDKVSEAVIAADSTQDSRAIDSARMEMAHAVAGAPSQLAGTTWKLVQLHTAQDSVIKPEAPAVYTIEFGKDGRANVVGGCNRGSGPYTATPPKDLTFGPLATTRAMCPPGSMSARFLGDFAKVRSYQLVGQALFISLDDNGIYAFAPEVLDFPVETPSDAAVFSCTDSTGARSRLIATFSGDSAKQVTLARGGKRIVAKQVRSGSGAKYEGPGVSFWNKGRDAMVTWLGTNLNCALTLQ